MTEPRHPGRNVYLLILCQGLLFINNTTLIAINGLVGLALAPNAALATIPVTAYVIGSALAATPIARLMRLYGRRVGFTIGTACGMLGTALAALGAYHRLFWLVCLGTLVVGIYNACGQLYRFAAAEVAPPSFRERAISWVMAGGIIGGVVGPNLANHTKDMLPVTFAGSYAATILVAFAAMGVLQLIRFPAQSAQERAGGGRPTREIMRQPAFVVAVLSATVSFGVMNLLMTATPLAMQMCSHPFSAAALVLEWHVIGMFAPSFFTGSLIKRYGVLNVIFVGVLLMFGCVGFALMGNEVMHFLGALFVLGVGWNFMFVGGTTLLLQTYRPKEKNRVQGTNDLLVFVTMATSSFASGALVTSRGWTLLNFGALPFLTIVAVAVIWLMLTQRRAATAAARA
jgi:MFS family permease